MSESFQEREEFMRLHSRSLWETYLVCKGTQQRGPETKLLKPISPYFTVHTVYQKVSFVKKSKWLHDSCVQPAPSGFTQILASVLRMLVHTVMYLISLVPKLGLRHHFPSTSATVLFCNCRPTKQESILFGLNYL